MQRLSLVLLSLVLTLSACSNVKGEVYTGDNKDQVTKDVGGSHLTDDEKRMYAAALVRSAFGSYDPANKTVGQIIADEQSFEHEQAVKEEAAKEAAARAEAAAAAERRQMQALASVQVTSKGYQPADVMNGIYQDSISLGVQFHNLGRKKITEIKGALVFSNHFGDRIYRVNLDESNFDGSALGPGGLYSSTYTSHFNQFEEDQVKFRDTQLSSMNVQWVPLGISFADGSAMTAADPDQMSSTAH